MNTSSINGFSQNEELSQNLQLQIRIPHLASASDEISGPSSEENRKTFAYSNTITVVNR